MTEQVVKDIVKRRDEAKRKRKHINTKLKQIGRIRSASDFSSSDGMTGKSDPTANEAIYRDELRQEDERLEKMIGDYDQALRSIFRKIQDPVVKMICRCRLVKHMSWAQIAELVELDEPAAKMRYYRFRDRQFGAA